MNDSFIHLFYRSCIMKIFTHLLFLLFLSVPTLAQEAFFFQSPEDAIEPGKVFRTSVMLSFPKSINFAFSTHQVCIEVSKQVRLLTPVCYADLPFQDTLIFPVKLLVNNSLDEIPDQISISIKLIHKATNEVVLSSTDILTIKEFAAVNLEKSINEINISQQAKNIVIPLRLSNPSRKAQVVEVKLNELPKSLKADYAAWLFSIPPRLDTIISVNIEVKNRNWAVPSDAIRFEMTHQGVIQNKIVIPVIWSSSKEKFTPPIRKGINNQNQVKLSYENNGLSFTRWQLEAGGQQNSKKKVQKNWHLRSLFYPKTNEIQLYNTFYEVKTPKNALRVGNLNIASDAILYGRGIHYKMGEQSNQFQLAYLNGAANLLAEDFNAPTPTGNSVMVGYEGEPQKNAHFGFQGVVQQKPNFRVGLFTVSGGRTKKKSNWNGRITLSGENQEIDSTINNNHFGLAGKFNFYKRKGKWIFSSNNQISSPWFAGLRRGQISLTEKVTYEVSRKINVVGFLRYFRTTPSLAQQRIDRQTSYLQPKASLVVSPNEYLRVSLSPYLLLQSANYLDYNDIGQKYQSKDWHFESVFYWYKNQHLFQLTGDIGYSSIGQKGNLAMPEMTMIWKLNWQRKQFGFSANYRKGGYYLFELWRDFQTNTQQSQLILEPRAQFNLIKNKLFYRLNAQITQDNIRKNWQTIYTNRLEWLMQPDFSIAAEVRYFTTKHFNSTFWMVSANKHFQFAQNIKGHFDLNLQLFLDENSNGKWDKDEVPAENLLVQIGSKTLVTDDFGEIEYKNLPGKFYKVTIFDMEGKLSPLEHSLFLNENKKLVLPVSAQAILQGQIINQARKFGMEQLDLSKLLVIAEKDNGQIYQAVVYPNGSYTMHLPEGQYQLYLEGKNLSKRVDIKDQHRRIIVQKEVVGMENFEIQVKQRKVNIKRF